MKRKIFVFLLTFSIIVTVFVLIVGMSFSIYVTTEMESEIDESLFEVLSGNTSSKIYYYENEEKREFGEATELEDQELYGGYRSVPTQYENVPEELVYAFVSIEDKRFFSHDGVDWKRTAGASLNYFLNFREEFGGSTITQQLIKNVTEKDDYSFQRKIQEILWALDLETKMSKEEILENYLNIINLSNGCYGVGAASKYYFSKDASELTLNECAAIAAITNNPSYYDPIRNPKNNQKRRQIILNQMYEQGYISLEEYNSAYNEELNLNVESSNSDKINLWYVDMVINDIINDLMNEKGYSRSMASMLIYTGGLKIYTAMDYNVQKTLENYYADTSNFYWNNTAEENPQSSMIIIDPYNGDILGVAGAVGTKEANRLQNLATETVRPAGSVIKPLSVYAPALEEGIITWSSVYDDIPVNFGNYNLDSSNGKIVEPVAWPKNANGVYRGLTNINYAIEHSVNTVTVRVLEELGIEKSFDFLQNKLGFNSLIKTKTQNDGSIITDMDYAALALGQFNYGASLREITAAYSIFPNSGVYNNYRSYYKVTDSNGNIILEKKYCGSEVISEENAIIMTEMLKNVLVNGTAKGITLKKDIPCAGKTGTTQSSYDRWFVGYTPYFIGGVWYGYEYPKTLSSESSGVCIEVWDEIMTRLHKRYILSGNVKSFDTSDKIETFEYCMDSGKLATEACKKDPRGSRIESGCFLKGSEPSEKCDCHVLVKYDIKEGGIVSNDCLFTDVEYVGLIRVERDFPKQIYVTDAQYVYKEINNSTMPETSPNLPFFNNALPDKSFCGISYGNRQYNRYCRAHFNYIKWKEEQGGNVMT